MAENKPVGAQPASAQAPKQESRSVDARRDRFALAIMQGMLANQGHRTPTALAAFRDGMVSNLTNPKPLMFMLAFLPQFVEPAHGSVTTQLLILSATQKLTGTLVMVSCALVSGSLGSWLSRHPRVIAWQQRFTAVVLIGLGARLLLAGDPRAVR